MGGFLFLLAKGNRKVENKNYWPFARNRCEVAKLETNALYLYVVAETLFGNVAFPLVPTNV